MKQSSSHPLKERATVVDELHATHPGICRMKALARSYVWWPKMDADLEQKVRQCSPCQENRKSRPEAPLHPWEWPHKPWVCLHLDYAGLFNEKNDEKMCLRLMRSGTV